MTRTHLDDVQWASVMLVIQRIPHAWKRDEAGLRRFVVAVLWVLRTGAPWRDLPEGLSHWPSVYHRFRRWCVHGWWEMLFKPLRPALPADGLVLVDSTTCKAHRAASGAAHSTAEAASPGRSRGGICSKIHTSFACSVACADGAGRILRLIDSPGHHSDLRMLARSWQIFRRQMRHSTAAMSRPSCELTSPHLAEPAKVPTAQPVESRRRLHSSHPAQARDAGSPKTPPGGPA